MEPCLKNQLRQLEATIEDNEELRDLVKRVLLEKGLEKALTTVISSWGEKQRERAQLEIDRKAGPYWKVGQSILIVEIPAFYISISKSIDVSLGVTVVQD